MCKQLLFSRGPSKLFLVFFSIIPIIVIQGMQSVLAFQCSTEFDQWGFTCNISFWIHNKNPDNNTSLKGSWIDNLNTHINNTDQLLNQHIMRFLKNEQMHLDRSNCTNVQ